MDTNTDKQAMIVEAARELFTAHGFKRVSMDEIAAYAGVAKGTIYLYFKSKADLFKYFVEEDMKMMEQIVSKTVQNSSSFFDELHSALSGMLKYRKSRPFIITMTKEAETIGTASIRECINMMNNAIINYIKKRLSKAIEVGDIRPCNIDIMSFIIFNIYMAVTYDLEKLHKNVSENEVLSAISLLFKEGLET